MQKLSWFRFQLENTSSCRKVQSPHTPDGQKQDIFSMLLLFLQFFLSLNECIQK